MNCKCGNKIPEKRKELGYTTCIQCSTEEKWSAIPVIYHKTGNTVQIVKDAEVAKEMLAMSQRTGFGTMRGMKPQQKSDSYKPKPKKIKNSENLVRRAVLPNPENFEKVGAEAMAILETYGIEKATEWLSKKVEDLCLTPTEMGRIRRILLEFSKGEKKGEKKSGDSEWWYSKRERPEEKSPVSEDVMHIFKNWKR